jgi:hypothetical protein
MMPTGPANQLFGLTMTPTRQPTPKVRKKVSQYFTVFPQYSLCDSGDCYAYALWLLMG